ncbi:ABC transporter ATP-binding protein [uncultured Ezakiella sp.]|uniref:ABC transporter transmembrane domain-containing protein n=1 Tax=uncultured Ezakiella sp. TaxID=1637529 RepID=UPI0025D2D81A|nr:ABC transporter ATP-binding protein [uncultured Ezakiella sp.]
MIRERYKKNFSKIFLLFITGIIVGSLSIFPMVFIQKVIDYLTIGNQGEFIKYIILYSLVYILVNIFKIALVNFGSKFELNLNREIRDEIVENILSTKIGLLEKAGHSNVFNVIIDDLKALDDKLIPLVFDLGFSISSFVIGSIIIIKYDYIMLFAMIAISAISTLVIQKILNKSEMASERSQIQRLNVINKFFDIIIGARDIKLFNKEDVFTSDFHQENHQLNTLDKKIVNIKNLSQALVSLLFNLIMATLILIGGLRVSQGSLSVGALIAIILYASMITDPIFNIIENQKEISAFKNSVKRIDETFKRIEKEDVNLIEAFKTIEFKDVSLKYGDNQILKDFNLVINKGDKLKINGRTGSGKSTLAKLITNMYKPTSGKIYVDCKENQTISLSAVFQENKLFNMSIIDNITFKSKVDEGKLNQIIKICRLEEVLEKYSENKIGFDSSTLSGGERTRVLLARALYKDCQLYIFDEISTGLDESLFYEIFDDLMNYLEAKTVISIDHKNISENYFTKSIFM